MFFIVLEHVSNYYEVVMVYILQSFYKGFIYVSGLFTFKYIHSFCVMRTLVIKTLRRRFAQKFKKMYGLN